MNKGKKGVEENEEEKFNKSNFLFMTVLPCLLAGASRVPLKLRDGELGLGFLLNDFQATLPQFSSS